VHARGDLHVGDVLVTHTATLEGHPHPVTGVGDREPSPKGGQRRSYVAGVLTRPLIRDWVLWVALVFAGIGTLSALTASDQAKAVRHTNDLDLIYVVPAACALMIYALGGPRRLVHALQQRTRPARRESAALAPPVPFDSLTSNAVDPPLWPPLTTPPATTPTAPPAPTGGGGPSGAAPGSRSVAAPVRPRIERVPAAPVLAPDKVMAVARESYPLPVALQVRLLQQSLEAKERYQKVIDVNEQLLLVLHTTAVAWAAGAHSTTPAIAAWATAVQAGGASAGHWRAVVHSVGGAARAWSPPIPGMLEALSLKKAESPTVAMNAIIEERNRSQHGDAPTTRHEHQVRAQALEDHLVVALRACSFLADTRWFMTERISWRKDSADFSVTGLEFAGDHAIPERVRLTSVTPLLEDEVVVLLPDGVVELAPFAVRQVCEKCGNEELHYLNRIDGRGASYRSLGVGHEVIVTERTTEITAALSRLQIGVG